MTTMYPRQNQTHQPHHPSVLFWNFIFLHGPHCLIYTAFSIDLLPFSLEYSLDEDRALVCHLYPVILGLDSQVHRGRIF